MLCINHNNNLKLTLEGSYKDRRVSGVPKQLGTLGRMSGSAPLVAPPPSHIYEKYKKEAESAH